VHPIGRRSYAQGGFVVCWAGLAAQRSQDRERVEAVGQSGEVDVITDRDARQDAVPCRGLSWVRINVDNDQAGRSARDADPELRVGTPPLLDAVLIEGGGVETVTPQTCRETEAVSGCMGLRTAVAAVGGRGLPACC